MMQLKPGHEGKDRSAGSLLRKRSVVTQGDGGKGGVPLKSDTPGSTYYTTKQEKESCFKRWPGTTETRILFASLLVTDLPRVETNVTVPGKQAATLKCHVCEIENSFGCTNPSNCPRDFHFCTSVAVRIYPRFFYVSKQCSRYCPVSAPFAPGLKSFVLVEPMPFLYAHCCSEFLCNTQEPNIREPEFREGGRASRLRSSGAWLAAFLTLSSV